MAAAPEVLQWARETLRGINVLTGYGRGPHGGGKVDLDPEVAEFLYRTEAELIRFLKAHGTTDPTGWVKPE